MVRQMAFSSVPLTQKPTATLQAEMLAPGRAWLRVCYTPTRVLRAPVQALGFHRQQDGYPGADRKRCPGVDTGSTNGLLTVEYDGEIMTLTDVQVAASYCSIAQAEGGCEAGLCRFGSH